MTGTGSRVDRKKKHLRLVYQAAVHIQRNVDFVHSQVYDHEKRVNPNRPQDDLELAISMFSYLLQQREDLLYQHQLKRARCRLEELVSDNGRFEEAFRTGSIGWNPDNSRFAAIERCLDSLKQLYIDRDSGLARSDTKEEENTPDRQQQNGRKEAVTLAFLLNQYIAKYRGFAIDFNHLAVSEYNLAGQTEDEMQRRRLYEQALHHDSSSIVLRKGKCNDIHYRNMAVYYDLLSNLSSGKKQAMYRRRAVLAQTKALRSKHLRQDPGSWYWLGIYQNKLALLVQGDWEEKVNLLGEAEESLRRAVRLRGDHNDHRQLAQVYLNIADSTMDLQSARYHRDFALVHLKESLRKKDDPNVQKKLAETQDTQRYSS
jgi:hypothetical protein